jgi:hypothetical protein
MFLEIKGRSALKADNLTAICELSDNKGNSTSHNPTCLQGLLGERLYFYLI